MYSSEACLVFKTPHFLGNLAAALFEDQKFAYSSLGYVHITRFE